MNLKLSFLTQAVWKEFYRRDRAADDTEPANVGLYVIEEQEIYQRIYRAIFPSGAISLLGISCNTNPGSIKDTVSSLDPDVLLLGTGMLEQETIETVKQVSAEFPGVGIVLLFMAYRTRDIKLLQKLTESKEAGMAIFSKQSLERVSQLRQIIRSVGEKQIILDPAFTSLLFAEKQRPEQLRGFTCRELDVLKLLAQGYTNQAIAGALCIDIRTVRHHINNMYSKFKADNDSNSLHARVSVARLYLETIGALVSENSLERELPS